MEGTALLQPTAVKYTNTQNLSRLNVTLAAHELSVSVNVKKSKAAKNRSSTHGNVKVLLSDVTVQFSPATLTALMGPSGAGKTTLLNQLAGQTTKKGIKAGVVTMNGKPITSQFKKFYCFVPQDDVLLSGLTPRETLNFVARLRFPSTISKRETQERIEAVLTTLKLVDCANTRIGNVDTRGVSGGERKRVSIAMELLTDPSVMFLDEPTSGLDSKMALDVVSLLQQLAADGRTVVCTIHQPSYQVFSKFDRLVMLSQGRICYVGKTLDSQKFLRRCGFDFPEQENPAEVWMGLLQDKGHTATLATTWASSQEAQSEVGMVRELNTTGTGMGSTNLNSYAVSKLTQFSILTQRAVTDHFKDPQKYLGSLFVKMSIGVLVGIVWLNQARHHKQSSIFPTQGVIFMVCLNSCMDTIMQTALLLPVSRALLLREYRNGYYSLPAYFASMIMCHSIAQCLNALVLAIPVYFMTGLQQAADKFFLFTAVLCMMAVLGVATGMLVGAVANDFQQAQQAVVPVLVPLILFSGYMIPYAQIPFYFRWLYHVSFLQYALSSLQINQFHNLNFEDCPPSNLSPTCIINCLACANCTSVPSCYQTGNDFLHANHIHESDLGLDIGIIAAYAFVVAVMGYYVTRRVVMTQ